MLAGAGCGKTKTIIARAAELIDKGTPADQIQILTFTRRAASELVGRVEQYLGDAAKGLKASTFHTFCMYLLRRNSRAFGLEQFTIIDRDDQMLMFRLLRGYDKKKSHDKKSKKNIVEKDAKDSLPTAAQICDLYSYARNTQSKLSTAILKNLPDAMMHKDEISQIMQAYEERKKQRNFLDYDDILAIVAFHLQQSNELVKWVAKQCRFILVDEMQDTNPLQWAILQPLLPYCSLFCVGDDAQSIYGFRGADFENIHSFADRVPNAQVLSLQENYRSTQQILDLSNWLLEQSEIEYNKKLHAYRGDGIKPILHIFTNEFEEANWIAQDLIARHQQGAHWNEHMILFRSGFAARSVERALIASNIPYRFIGGVKLLESAHVKDMLSMLRVMSNPRDDIAWMRFLTLWNGIGDMGASKLSNELIAIEDLELRVQCLKQSRVQSDAIDAFEKMHSIPHVEKVIDLAVEALTEQLAENYKGKDWERRVKDFQLVKQLARKHSTLSEFLEAYILDPISISEVERSNDQDIVTLITVHSAKGTEQKVCYVPQVSPNSYPHSRAQGDFDEVEEERRVLYVALTRAKNELILTKQNFNIWSLTDQVDDKGRKVESYFLNNLPEHLVQVEIHQSEPWRKSKPTKIQPKRYNFGIDLD